ncbi:hypothetical protein KM043_004794 [Ampulex compressa]|nr:hypothetical protein KM043_004794 [Ampulex compressa]
MRAIFTTNGIIDIVNGTRVKLQITEPAAQNTWIKEDAKTQFIISLSMEPRQLESLLVCASANEMWTKLSAIHEQKSATNKLLLTQKFHEYRMETSNSVVQYVAKVQNMAMKLIDLGEKVLSVAIMTKIIASLPSKFNALKTAWDSVDVADQTVDNLVERLIKEELRLTADEEMTNALAAMTMSGNRKSFKPNEKSDKTHGRRFSKDRSEVECCTCKRKGHYSREFRKKKKNNSQREMEMVQSQIS